jgi:hypothetical protein
MLVENATCAFSTTFPPPFHHLSTATAFSPFMCSFYCSIRWKMRLAHFPPPPPSLSKVMI